MSTVAEGPRIYNLFPLLAGSIDRWEQHLDRIAGMGFNWIFVNPFHATGASRSLYAVQDYYRLNPVLRGASKRSSDELIRGFVAAADRRGLAVMIDLVINHAAKDALLTQKHPEWFAHEADGSLKSPFAVDPADTRKKTVWEDLAEIDYSDRRERQDIIGYFAEYVRHHLALGVRGFRCDAAYKVPKEVWRSLIDAARETVNDAVFVAENLGALLEQALALRSAGFDYLFNSSKWWDFQAGWLLEQYEMFRDIAPTIAFPETHDTERLVTDLAARGVTDRGDVERAYQQAYLFAAAFSAGVMIPMGYEYGFRKKLHVVNTTPDDWEQPAFDLTDFIAGVNRMKAGAPVLNEEGPQRQVRLADGRVACLVRRRSKGRGWAVTLVNVDAGSPVEIRWDASEDGVRGGREITPGGTGASLTADKPVTLRPREVRLFVGP